MFNIRKSLLAASAGSLLVPVLAIAGPMVGDTVGTDLQQVTNALAEAGYEVREVEMDDGEIEALVHVDGQLLELEISPQSGMIVSIERADDMRN
jgi:hypothetical protein